MRSKVVRSWVTGSLLYYTSEAMLTMPTTCASTELRPASKRPPEEQGSTPVPHHAAGGRLSLLRPSRGEQGSIPGERTGSGTDPPVFCGKDWQKP